MILVDADREPQPMIVGAYQFAPRLGDFAANAEASAAAVRTAVAAGARLVVLPELATSGYVLSSAAEAAPLAIPADHELFAAWAAECERGEAVVVGGFCEVGEDGKLYNSAAVVDASGVRAVYRKLHLWDAEKVVFEPGEAAPPVVDTVIGRIGVLVCYDNQFPEMARALALEGADLIAVPTNWSPPSWPAGERPAEVMAAMVAARANGVFMVCCDRVGTERGVSFFGLGAVIGPSGWVLAEHDEGEGLIVAEVDLADARTKTRSARNDALADRRPQFYARLANDRGGRS
jgi:predicted amidohydrolase